MHHDEYDEVHLYTHMDPFLDFEKWLLMYFSLGVGCSTEPILCALFIAFKNSHSFEVIDVLEKLPYQRE